MGIASWFGSAGPDVAIEIAPAAVSIAALGTRGAEPAIQAYAAAPLPVGAVVPSLAGHNIVDRDAVLQALRAACERAGQRPRRAALVLPDTAARVALLRFDTLPARREDLDQLVRWQIRKSLPFAIEDGCVAHSPGARSGAGSELIVVAARRATVREYEGICDAAGIHAGLVDLSTFGVINAYLAGESSSAGDWLLVHLRPEYTSLAILREGHVIFFRNQATGDAETLADVVHQTVMYYQDRLGGVTFSRALADGVGAAPGAVEAARMELEARLGQTVERFDPTRLAPLTDRIGASPEQLAGLTPLVGMLLRARKGAIAA